MRSQGNSAYLDTRAVPHRTIPLQGANTELNDTSAASTSAFKRPDEPKGQRNLSRSRHVDMPRPKLWTEPRTRRTVGRSAAGPASKPKHKVVENHARSPGGWRCGESACRSPRHRRVSALSFVTPIPRATFAAVPRPLRLDLIAPSASMQGVKLLAIGLIARRRIQSYVD